jgi:hypothetical protein
MYIYYINFEFDKYWFGFNHLILPLGKRAKVRTCTLEVCKVRVVSFTWQLSRHQLRWICLRRPNRPTVNLSLDTNYTIHEQDDRKDRYFFFFFFCGLPRWRNGQAFRIGPYPSVRDESEEVVLTVGEG